MALTFQQRSRRRKLIYLGVMLVLSLAMVWHRNYVQAQANKYDLQETDLGDVDLGGSMARYALVSFRGPLICGLWWETVERQSRHDWAQMRLLIQTITKLQPHFKQPWIYQSWNLAYNVSVEFDRVQDKYFFIAEGSQLLADGEKQNRAKVYDPDTGEKREVPDPEMCWHAGFYQQQKVCVSDEAAYFKILLQLSCINPEKWDPDSLRQNPKALEEFKQSYPALIQRVRELKRIPAGAEDQLKQELLGFFEAYRRIPSLYASSSRPRADARQLDLTATRFPLWAEGMAPPNPEDEPVQDAYEVSRGWYERGNLALPPPNPEPDEPRSLARDERRYRMPQKMFSLLYRCWPAKARSIQAANLDKEGRFAEGRRVWDDAWRRWKGFGLLNGIDLESTHVADLRQRARLYQERFPTLAMQVQPPPASRLQSEPGLAESYQAAAKMFWHGQNRNVTNYAHWEAHSNVNRSPRAGDAWRHCYLAQHDYRADLNAARKEYELGLDIWASFLAEPRADFLLALGPTWDWGGCFATQPAELLQRTPFGYNRQSQEDLGELHGKYLRIRAQCDAPGAMLSWASRDRLQLLVSQIESPVCPLAGLRSVPENLMPRPLEQIENVLTLRPGPLDRFLLPDIREKYSWTIEPERVQERPGQVPQPIQIPAPAGADKPKRGP